MSKITNTYLIYDSECLMCQNFLHIIDKYFYNKFLNLNVSKNVSRIINSKIDVELKNYLINNFNSIDNKSMNSIIYIKNQQVFTRFEAIINILIDLKHRKITMITRILELIIPKFIGNFLYEIISLNRINISKMILKRKCKLFFKNLILI